MSKVLIIEDDREMFLTSQETEVEDKELNIGDLMINEGMRKVQIQISQYRRDENERIRQSAIQVRACT